MGLDELSKDELKALVQIYARNIYAMDGVWFQSIEHADFAKVIDDRIECETVSCFPDVADDTCACAWKFTLST